MRFLGTVSFFLEKERMGGGEGEEGEEAGIKTGKKNVDCQSTGRVPFDPKLFLTKPVLPKASHYLHHCVGLHGILALLNQFQSILVSHLL